MARRVDRWRRVCGIYITPRRIGNVGMIGEKWDIGISVGGEVSGSVVAQAGAEARVGYGTGFGVIRI